MKPIVAGTVVVVWLILLTICVGLLGIGELVKIPEPKLFAHWQGESLVVWGRDDRYLITHLENLENRTIARLPEPVWVVESGGVTFSVTNLAQLRWVEPAQYNQDVFNLTSSAAPRVGAEMRVLYFIAEKAGTKAANQW